MAKKWERLIFNMDLADGRRQIVSGPSHKGLAMLRVGTGMWSLTHIRTGLRVISISGAKSDAYAFAESIAALIDWDSYDDRASLVAVPDLAARIGAVAAAFKNDTSISGVN